MLDSTMNFLARPEEYRVDDEIEMPYLRKPLDTLQHLPNFTMPERKSRIQSKKLKILRNF